MIMEFCSSNMSGVIVKKDLRLVGIIINDEEMLEYADIDFKQPNGLVTAAWVDDQWQHVNQQEQQSPPGNFKSSTIQQIDERALLHHRLMTMTICSFQDQASFNGYLHEHMTHYTSLVIYANRLEANFVSFQISSCFEEKSALFNILYVFFFVQQFSS